MSTLRHIQRAVFLCMALLAGMLATPLQAAQADNTALDELARDTERAEAIRAVKKLQHAYSQYAQYGLWSDLGALFARDGEWIWGDTTVTGPAAITAHHTDKVGGGRAGLPEGVVNSLFVDVPLVNLSVDGKTAQARWYGIHMLGGAADARWESGTFQNDYVLEDGVWKIARLHFHPQFGGPYEQGWKTFASPLPRVPYHFRTEAEAGTPIPPPSGPAPRTRATLASLEKRIDTLNAEDAARNLQNAYGYYVDRKMWDDVTDLFTADGVLELGGIGLYDGPANIRRALERHGPAGLKEGQLHDHPLFDTNIEISADGMEAQLRGLELGMLGDYSSGTAHWAVSVFVNRFVKQDGVWKIREMRVFPLLKTDFYQGWGKSRIGVETPEQRFAPNRPLPAADAGANLIPAFLPHPVTGREASYPRGARVAAKSRLLPAPAAPKAQPVAGSTDERIAEARRRLALSMAWDGAANITAAYTHYIDDSQWTSMGAIFARNGNKQVPFNGYYIGPERIAHRPGARPAPNGTNPGNGGWHWLMQPVIHVAPDGRSAKMRTRLFHPLPTATGGMMEGGMYPNNQAVLEDGVWKLWTITIDEPYFTGRWPTGWARPAPPAPPRGAAAGAPGAAAGAPRGGGGAGSAPATPPLPGAILYPPNISNALLGRRMEGFVGGTGEPVRWPGLLPMWFHYKNPVSGREPERYWPNCATCEYAPGTSMDQYGYLLPET
jgi:hypothetical protein